MKRIFIGAAAIAAMAALSACGDDKKDSGGGSASASSHASCKDAFVTLEYMDKFRADLKAAVVAGKVSEEAAKKASDELILLKPDPADPGFVCKWADEKRKALGF